MPTAVTITLREVASRARVSLSTASRALSGNGLANRNTEQRVRRIATELGYRPNTLARGLKTRNSQLIGLVLHNLVNASFQRLAEIVQKRLSSAGYQVILCITSDDPEQELRTLVTLSDHRVDGLIIVPSGKNGVLLNKLEASGVPVVCVVRRDEAVTLECVLAADPDGAYAGTNHLIALGHRRIGLIVGRQETTSGRERLAGYLRSLHESGLSVDQRLICSGPYLPETGADACSRLLDMDSPPTALFVANHEAAYGALRVLSERHIAVPEQLSILCYEDMPWFRWHRPAISVVDNGASGIANLAVDRLLLKVGGAFSPAAPSDQHEFRVGARVIARESCLILPLSEPAATPKRNHSGAPRPGESLGDTL